MQLNALCNRLPLACILGRRGSRFITTKTMRVMQLTAIMLTVCTMTVAAKSISQSITYSGKDVPMNKVFKEVERQTNFFVLYNKKLLDREAKITVDASNMPIADFLSLILKNQPLSYSIQNTSITIEPKNEKAAESFKPLAISPSLTAPPITGIVRGPNGQPIAGANVIVKGTKRGTTTNSDGAFSIEANKGDIVIISSIGYTEKQLPVTNNNTGISELQVSNSKLDEVQIIAYGQTSKRFSTGVVTSVRAAEIAKQPVMNPILALQGRVPGLTIEQSTGLPGSGIKIRIQGQNSLDKGSDPLYVIDGVPYISQLLPSLSGIVGNSGTVDPNTNLTTNGNPLSFVNPSDVESIEILKDADATSIYGSRAAAGAILITTKKGKQGQSKVDINVQTGQGRVTRKVDLLNTAQYLVMRKEAKSNANATIDSLIDFDLTHWSQSRNVDWQKELIGNISHYNNATASLSGGNTNNQYLLSGTYHKETTAFSRNLGNEKGAFHLNLNSQSKRKILQFQFDAKYQVDNNKLISTDLTSFALRLAPNAPQLFNSNGTLNWEPLSDGSSTWSNPLSFLELKYINLTKNLLTNALVTYKVTKNIELKNNFGYNNLSTSEVQTTPLSSMPPEYRSGTYGSSNFGYGNISSWIVEPQISYKGYLGALNIEGLLGGTFSNEDKNYRSYAASGYGNDQQLENILAASNIVAYTQYNTKYKYNAFFGRIKFIHSSRYILNLTARRDGSSRFGSENLFHNFGSVAGGWIFTSERLVRENLSWLSFGKISVSYGTTGNDQIGDYKFLSLYNPLPRPNPYQNVIGYSPNGLSNPYLQWEETRKLQMGLNLGFFEDRLLLSINRYINRSSNQLQTYALPVTTGFNSIVQNFPALIENSGYEFELNTEIFKEKKFEWDINLNLTIPRNKLLKYENLSTSGFANTYIIGQPITLTKVYKFHNVDPVTGRYQVEDKNGKPTLTPAFNSDNTFVINTAPNFYGGFQNTIRFKSLTLDFILQFTKQIGKNYTIGSNPGTFSGLNNSGNQPVTVLDRWQKEGDNSNIQRFNSTFSLARYFNNANLSNLVYSDASYIRLKNISLYLELPPKIGVVKFPFSGRAFIQGQNLLTVTKFQGLDPESKSTTSLPPLSVFVIGFQLNL
jgi:TonB-dependent starch-binding outer membrane protein SusC